jgi:hypothetical protein
MKPRLTLFFLLVAFSCSAFAFGSSNLSFGYPEESCRKPSKPFKPYSFNSQWEVDAYNNQVDSYNSDYQRYIRCVKEYLESAANDIKTIQQKMDEAVEKAKRASF